MLKGLISFEGQDSHHEYHEIAPNARKQRPLSYFSRDFAPFVVQMPRRIRTPNTTKSHKTRESSGPFRVFREISRLSWSKCPAALSPRPGGDSRGASHKQESRQSCDQGWRLFPSGTLKHQRKGERAMGLEPMTFSLGS